MRPDDLCPWSDWDPGTVAFCEERLCELVREPANAWSSLAYLVAAGWMVGRDRAPALLVVAQVLIGVGSFFFHASGTFAGELVDQVGMYVLSAIILSYAVGELRGWSATQVAVAWASIVSASAIANTLVQPVGIPLFAVQLSTGLWLQLWLGGRVAPARYRDLKLGIGIFVVSFAIWLTDITQVICEPTFHLFNGHAAWHILNAVSIVFLARFYRSARLASRSPAA